MRKVCLVATFVLTTACKDDTAQPPAPEPVAQAAQPVAPAPPPPPAPADASPGQQLKLPSVRIDATKILGMPRTDVDKILGEANENEVYERGPDNGILVLYDKGKAAGIEVLGTETGWDDFSDEQRAFVREWFGVKPNNMVGVSQVTVGASLDGYSLGLYVTKSIPALKKIVDKRTAEQEKVLRDDMERAEAEGLVARNVPRSIGHAEGDVLQVRSAEEDCNQQTLVGLKRRLGTERLRHFKQLVCWTAGRTRVAINAK